MFTEIDHQKFRNLRITHVATRFEELISDEANDELTPEQIFLTAVDDALAAIAAASIDPVRCSIFSGPVNAVSIAICWSRSMPISRAVGFSVSRASAAVSPVM